MVGRGPSAWHPWTPTLVINHPLPLYRVLAPMNYPLPSPYFLAGPIKGRGNKMPWAGRLSSWVLILGKSLAITGSQFF